MSCSCSRSGSSRSSIAWALKRCGEMLRALERAVRDRDRARPLRREVRRTELDHLAGADEEHARLAQRRERSARRASPPRRPSTRRSRRCRCWCAPPSPRRTCAGRAATASRPACPPPRRGAPRPSSGRGSAARRAPSSRGRRRRGTRGAPPPRAAACTRRARGPAGRAAGSRRATRAPRSARRRRSRARCGCRSRGSPSPRPAAPAPPRRAPPASPSALNATFSRIASGALW